MSSTKLRHYAFRNNGNLTFADETANWGLDTPSFGNGATYADLDGDGALDLVVNNANDEAFVYRNNARALLKDNHYLQVSLEGPGGETALASARRSPFSTGRRPCTRSWSRPAASSRASTTL